MPRKYESEDDDDDDDYDSGSDDGYMNGGRVTNAEPAMKFKVNGDTR